MTCIGSLEESQSKILKEILGINEQPSLAVNNSFERIKKYIPAIRWIPGLKMVAVCNSLSMYAVDEESDIDLFIVTQPKRLWTVRILVTLIFQLLGVRRYGNKVRGRFCLSFFATTEGLDMSEIAVKGGDPYLQGWVFFLSPIFNRDKTYEKFIEKNLHWIANLDKQYKRNTQYLLESGKLRAPDSTTNIPKNTQTPICSKVGNMFESVLKKIFLPRALRTSKKLGNPWGVIISETYLKFHPHDRRMELQEAVQNPRA